MGKLWHYAERPLSVLKVADVYHQHVPAIVTLLMRDGKDATAQEAVSNVRTWAVRLGHRDNTPLIRSRLGFTAQVAHLNC